MRNSHVSCFLLKSQKKISWNMRFSHETGDTRFFHRGLYKKKVLSHEKITCLKRKSHISRENLMSQEKISCLISFGPPPQRENILSPVSWENLSYLPFFYIIPLCLLTSYLLSLNSLPLWLLTLYLLSANSIPPVCYQHTSCMLTANHLFPNSIPLYLLTAYLLSANSLHPVC